MGRRRTLTRSPFGTLYQVRAGFDGFDKDYYVIDFGARVGVVAARDGAVLLAAQYRFLVDRVAWEIPGGRVDRGESPEEAARRECLEETGVDCRGLKTLIAYRPGLDNVDNPTTVFYSERLTEARTFVPDATEVLAVAWLPLDECVSLILERKIVDALTVAGVLAYRCLVAGRRGEPSSPASRGHGPLHRAGARR